MNEGREEGQQEDAVLKSHPDVEEHPRIDNMDFDQDVEERRHFLDVCDSFRQYATFARRERANHAARLSALPSAQKTFLPQPLIPGTDEWQRRQHVYREAEVRNQFFLDSMLRYHGQPSSQDVIAVMSCSSPVSSTKWASDDNMSKVGSVLKQIWRDWSREGAEERNLSYKPILDAVEKFLPLAKSAKTDTDKKKVHFPRLSVPGAGVGRLALELAQRGYEVQGNEFSVHMLLASDFILNGCTTSSPFVIAPWVGSTRNVANPLDQCRKIAVPDVDPRSLITSCSLEEAEGSQADFSMAAGEFVSIYSKPSEHGQWNGVVSCFFLDTAPCIIEYLHVIWNMLIDDGMLINVGPLLYHWSGPPARPEDLSETDYHIRNQHMDKRYLSSIDLPWHDIRKVMLRIGFEFLVETVGMPSTYTADPESLMKTSYKCVFFVARKKGED